MVIVLVRLGRSMRLNRERGGGGGGGGRGAGGGGGGLRGCVLWGSRTSREEQQHHRPPSPPPPPPPTTVPPYLSPARLVQDLDSTTAAIMCDCFHLAFPNWHAASSGTERRGEFEDVIIVWDVERRCSAPPAVKQRLKGRKRRAGQESGL
ncbi:unnamed protein product [Pleuronectes platessa]|uniref:Uncharacterized protein n=1 Tax=Pleuronectes platessa TaxID=8262 RepID=A0A9N7VYF7_PLEPL|nr:unnamed protein product [Pleuronectes platessa]